MKKTRTAEEITESIIMYFETHADVFTDCIEELDGYNGYLGDNRYYPMEYLDEFYRDTEPTELLNRAFFGHDADTYTIDAHGDRVYGAFNPNWEHFTLNGCGNLISTNYKDYSNHLDKWAVEAMSECRAYVDAIESEDKLKTLFDELEAIEG